MEVYKDKIKCSFTLSKELKTKYKIACVKHGMSMSARIEKFIKDDTDYLENLGKPKEQFISTVFWLAFVNLLYFLSHKYLNRCIYRQIVLFVWKEVGELAVRENQRGNH